MAVTDRNLYDHLTCLGRRYRPSRRLARWPIDAAALVNVALLVLMFFIAGSSFVLQPGVAVRLPEAPFSGGARYGNPVVMVAQGGMLFFEDERVTIDGFRSAAAKVFGRAGAGPLIIEADRDVPHGRLIEVYDAAVQAGAREVVLATGLPRAGEASP